MRAIYYPKPVELTGDYQKLAQLRRKQEDGISCNLLSLECFPWDDTPEKDNFWHDVSEGRNPPIPEESLAELRRHEKEAQL